MSNREENPASGTTTDSGSTISTSRLIRLPEVMHRVGMRRSAIYKRMSEGRFPQSRSLGPRCAVWVEEEIDAWIESIGSPS